MGATARAIDTRGSFNDNPLRNVLSESIRRSNLSRAEIADRMTLLVGQPITLNVLNNWIAPGREVSRMPACFVPAFVQVTRSDLILRFLMGRELATVLKLGELTVRAIPGALDKLQKSKRQTADEIDQRSLFE